VKSDETIRTSWPRAFGWAVYLGMSWTWCIGMFLPVLFIRDYGLAAWFVFAIPNVVGAAAMGWVLRSRDISATIVQNHRLACSGFSLITVAFHAFFASWMICQLIGDNLVIALGVTGGLSFLSLLILRLVRGEMVLPIVGLLFSACMIALFASDNPGWPVEPRVLQESPRHLLFLAPVCVVGFLLNPYLDLTFHRARQQTHPSEARIAFGIGFGVFFFSMITFTLFYAKYLWGVMTVPTLIGSAIVWHLIVQTALTTALHLHEMKLRPARDGMGVAGAIVLAIGLGQVDFSYAGLDGGELIYRCFMSFYGLAFPAYVWLCMLPARGAHPPNGRAWRVLAGVILIASPMYWLAFIESRMVWLMPGLAVVLLARLLIRTNPTQGRAVVDVANVPL